MHSKLPAKLFFNMVFSTNVHSKRVSKGAEYDKFTLEISHNVINRIYLFETFSPMEISFCQAESLLIEGTG